MRRHCQALLALTAVLCGCMLHSPVATPVRTPTAPAEAATMSGPSLALVRGTLFDGTGADPLLDSVVLISRGRVAAVGPADLVTVPAGYEVIDATGLYLVPGLINAHVHGGYDESRLKAWAAGGVTTVRDLSAAPPAESLFRVRNSLRADPSNARLVAAGPFVTVPDGYPIVPWGAQALTVTTVKDAVRTTNQLIDEGADIIKISLEAGRGFGRVIKVLSAEQAKAIVDAAHSRGRRVSAHITAAEDIARCLAAGVDDIAHMPSDTLSADLAATVASRGIYWVPTLELWHNVGAAYGLRAGSNLRRFVAAGGLVALGTDYAGYAAEFDLGLPIREMEWMLEAGLTNREVLLAATRNAAVVCGLGRELGTIQSGWIADIIVLGADPLTDIHALQDLRYVVHNGQIIRQMK